jgi:hypothetical protein
MRRRGGVGFVGFGLDWVVFGHLGPSSRRPNGLSERSAHFELENAAAHAA